MIGSLLGKLGLGKIQLIVGGLLISMLVASALYTKHLIGENAVLNGDLNRSQVQISSLQNNITTQKERYESSLRILSERDDKIKILEDKNKETRKTIKGLKEKNEEVRNYLDTRIPDELYKLLLPSKTED